MFILKKYLVIVFFGGVGLLILSMTKPRFSDKLWTFTQQNQKELLAEPTQHYVVALGRIEPEGEIVQLSGNTSFQGSRLRVAQILVKKQDLVEKGQVVAILDNYKILKAALAEAEAQLEVAKSRLLQVKAGESQSKIEAQKAVINQLDVELKKSEVAFSATITRLNSELSDAEKNYQRYYYLYQEGSVSSSEIDSRKLAVKIYQAQLDENLAERDRILGKLKEQIQEATKTLEDIQEVREVDVQVAEAEVKKATAAVNLAKANLEVALIVSPISGKILDIHVRPGELLNEQGILEIGQTNQMYVKAEVYETDIKRIKIGDKATINSSILKKDLQGTVTDIGLKIGKKDILDTDPLADEDSRIVETTIRLTPEDSQLVSSLSNLKVEIMIFTSESQNEQEKKEYKSMLR